VITLEHLLAVPDVLRVEEQELAAEDLKTALDEALKLAHAGLMTMKDQEGAALVKEMRQRLDTLSTLLEQVEGRAPEAAEGIRQKLEERLEKLLGDNGLDPQRLAQEVALLADKANINEEIERLGIHIGHFPRGPGRGRTGGQAAEFPASGDAPRSEHHGQQDQRHGHHTGRHRHEGRGRVHA
jgi:uncharacterized protein (TIGR00255 family)